MKGFDNPPVNTQEQKTPQKSSGKLRRFVTGAVLAVGAIGAQLPSNAGAQTAEKNNPGQIAETKKAEQIRTELQKSVEEYRHQETNLQPKEAEAILSAVPFLNGVKINRTILAVKDRSHPILGQKEAQPDYFEIAKDEAMKEGRIKIEPNMINLVGVDLNIARPGVGASYYPEIQTVFINSDSVDKVPTYEKAIYDEAVNDEMRSRIYAGTEVHLASLWADSMKINNPLVRSIPTDLLNKHGEALIRFAKLYRLEKAQNLIITRNALRHELYHHFHTHMLGKIGYSGPSTKELLAMTLKSYGQRFRVGNTPSWASGIGSLLNGHDLNDDATVNKLADSISATMDLTQHRIKSEEELENLTPTERVKILNQENSFKFFNEMMARLYDGALGHTPEKVKKDIEESEQRYGISAESKSTYESMFFAPTAEEIGMLRQMHWHGRSIVSAGK